MPPTEVKLTTEQKQLIYLLSLLTNVKEGANVWIKETPLHAFIFYAIQKGVFNAYDYAPISSPFLGKGRKFVNISKEGEDDLGDLRELELLETIRISSTKHEFITGYRPTEKSKQLINSLNTAEKNKIDELFICSACKKGTNSLKISPVNSEFVMVCNACQKEEVIPLIIPEDVSYSTRPHFFPTLEKNAKKED